MRQGPRAETGDGDLAARISECIAEAESGGLHVVAAYLETALHALHPRGKPAAEAPKREDG